MQVLNFIQNVVNATLKWKSHNQKMDMSQNIEYTTM